MLLNALVIVRRQQTDGRVVHEFYHDFVVQCVHLVLVEASLDSADVGDVTELEGLDAALAVDGRLVDDEAVVARVHYHCLYLPIAHEHVPEHEEEGDDGVLDKLGAMGEGEELVVYHVDAEAAAQPEKEAHDVEHPRDFPEP